MTTSAHDPQVPEVADRVFAYIQPDGSKLTASTTERRLRDMDAPVANHDIEVTGGTLRVVSFGGGPRAVLAVHGITASAMSWQAVARALPADWQAEVPALRVTTIPDCNHYTIAMSHDAAATVAAEVQAVGG